MRVFSKNCLPKINIWGVFAISPICFLFIVVASYGTASAWGPDGHRIICEIAERHLLPRTREIIHKNFNIGKMTLVANWADAVKKSPRKPDVRHYTNIEEGSWTYDQTRDCPDKKCVTEKIREYEKTLSNTRLFYFDRKDALKLLIHLVGDIHQPMHLGNLVDRGGNEIKVIINGEETNLHALWDSGLIFHEDESLIQYAEKLDSRTTVEEISLWIKTYVEDWSNESRELSLKFGYPLIVDEEGNVAEEYIARGRLIVEEQLRRAGVRLAHILNRSIR
jgi:hypothetical protein